MKRILVITGLMVFQLMFAVCSAQNISLSASQADTVPFGLKSHKWNKIQEVWSRKNHPVKVLLSDGDSLEGQIVYLYNDTVVLYVKSSSFINQYVAGNEIVNLHRDSINIFHDPESMNRSGLLWGTAAGSAVGVGLFFAGGGWLPPVIIIAPALIGAGIGGRKDSRKNRNTEDPLDLDLNSEKARKRYLLFPNHLPGLSGTSEQGSVITPETFAAASFDDLLNASPQIARLFGTPVLSLSGHAGLSSNAPIKGKFGTNLGFSFTYRPLTRLKIGYLYNEIVTNTNESYDYSSSLSFYENVWIANHTLFLKYVPITANPFLNKRFEASVGVGTSFNKFNHQSSISHNYSILNYESSTSNNRALTFMSDFDFYLTRTFSFFLSINKSIGKPFKPKNLSAVNPLTGESIFYETMEVYPSPLDVIGGLRLHFLRR